MRLSVIYDAECALCRRCRDWLNLQPKWVALDFVPLQSPDLPQRFPGIEALAPHDQLLVVSDKGEIYRGSSAWIMCLYALRDYRAWSQRLAHPALRPWAQRVCELVSQNRLQLSRWLFRQDLGEINRTIAARSASVAQVEAMRLVED
ncbi:MAG: DUF393 domain-containing protein [Chthoniobacterales bacterium]